MSDDGGTAHARQHANRLWARVIRDVVSGQWLYAAGTLEAEPNGVRPTVAEAKRGPGVADLLQRHIPVERSRAGWPQRDVRDGSGAN